MGRIQVRRRLSVVTNETLDLRSILLREIPFGEYASLRRFWGLTYHLQPGGIYSQILHPWKREGTSPEDYERLLWLLTEVDCADELFVRCPTGDMKRYTRNVAAPEIREMARIASSDDRKRNYLEIYLRRELRGIKLPRASISFTEWQGSLVGYKIEFPESLDSLFSFESRRQYWRNYALWMPEEGITRMDVPNPKR